MEKPTYEPDYDLLNKLTEEELELMGQYEMPVRRVRENPSFMSEQATITDPIESADEREVL
jgi:O-glycosyl hydrolase